MDWRRIIGIVGGFDMAISGWGLMDPQFTLPVYIGVPMFLAGVITILAAIFVDIEHLPKRRLVLAGPKWRSIWILRMERLWPFESLITMHRASRKAYEAMEAEFLDKWANSEYDLKDPLSWFAVSLADVYPDKPIRVFGKREPSTKLREIDPVHVRQGKFENEGAELIFWEDEKYTDLWISRSDFRERLKAIKAKWQ